MHDIPYIKSSKFGPEIVASMTSVVSEIQSVLKRKIPLGVQVLACGGKEAIAVAKATQCQFIRNEGFVFSHIGDEGFIGKFKDLSFSQCFIFVPFKFFRFQRR